MANKLNLFLLFLLLVSCNPIRKAERRVLENHESAERVFRELEKTRPCANDTSFITSIDTVVEFEHFASSFKQPSFRFGQISYSKDTVIKKVKVTEYKTSYIVDNRRLNVALDSVRFYKTLSVEYNKDKYQYKKALILLIISILIYIIIKIKL